MRRPEKPISEAHRWARRRQLWGRKKARVESWQLQLAVEDFALPERERFSLVPNGSDGDTQSVNGVPFPDGSIVWWDDDEFLLGVTDPDGIDISGKFVVER